MKQRDFLADEHFVRCCSRQKQIRDEHGVLQGVTWQAFALRVERSETYLSGALLEHINGSQSEQLASTVKNLKTTGLSIKPNHALALCNANSIKDCGLQRTRKLRVRHEPKKTSLSYAAIRGLPIDNSDSELLELLAAQSVGVLRLVSDIPSGS